MADVYVNQLTSVLVIAPAPHGKLDKLVEYKQVVFYPKDTNDAVAPEHNIASVKPALTRWIFADVAQGTLVDDWGNAYDHQVHSLLSGNLADGKLFLEKLAELGCIIEETPEMFVPFQRLDPTDQESSDSLRSHHARAFVLARRPSVSLADIITSIRDGILL
jgi:hypothetical protein